MSKELITRIQHLYDTKTNWDSVKDKTPLQGELVIYHDVEGKQKFKIGDGTRTLEALPFIENTGPQGQPGQDGHSPVVTIQNNRWYVDGVDTGNTAIGADGVGIVSITKTSSSGLVDTYTITFTNGTSTTFTVTNGKDGTSVTHSWSGTTLNITSASGTTSADLKGDKGDLGVGIDSIVTTESFEDNGQNVITIKLTNGVEHVFSVKNGSTGIKYSTGETPPDVLAPNEFFFIYE